MATEAGQTEVNAAKVRALDALAKFLEALTDLAGPLARLMREELDGRKDGAGLAGRGPR